jgi:hypothetical protein
LTTLKPPLSSPLMFMLRFIYSYGKSQVRDIVGSLYYRSQRDSQHGEVTHRTNISRTRCCFTTPPVDHEVRGVYAAWKSKPSNANSTPCRLLLFLSFSPKSFCTSMSETLGWWGSG